MELGVNAYIGRRLGTESLKAVGELKSAESFGPSLDQDGLSFLHMYHPNTLLIYIKVSSLIW